MKVCLFGAHGQVAAMLGPSSRRATTSPTDVPRGRGATSRWTSPARKRCSGTPSAVWPRACRWWWARPGSTSPSSTGWRARRASPAVRAELRALGAVLTVRFAEEASASFPRAEILELHADTSATRRRGRRARPSGWPATSPSTRCAFRVSSRTQEVILGGPGGPPRSGTTTSARHSCRACCVPSRRSSLPPGLTVGLEQIL